MRLAKHFKACHRGSAAVEFALVAPIFLMIVLTTVAYGIYLTAAHSVQQLAADAARTAVAGVTPQERVRLVDGYLQRTTFNNYLLNRENMTIKVEVDPTNPDQFTVSLVYDASSLPVWDLYSFAMPDKFIKRFATIRIGGV